MLDGAGIFEDWSHNTVIKAEQNHRCLLQVVLVAPPGTLPNLTYGIYEAGALKGCFVFFVFIIIEIHIRRQGINKQTSSVS